MMSQKRSRRAYEADLHRQEASYVFYGTPLPPLDENTRDDGSFVPLWKQEVTDERGRKRLHGAFTGGFSAGYFNSVGSKEGWTPATFVSSRANRANNVSKPQKPEDYMDEEDLREQEESRHLMTTNAQAGFGTQDDANIQGGLMDIFRPRDSSLGETLLMRMGWKQGQTIGAPVLHNAGSSSTVQKKESSPTLDSLARNDTKGLGFGENRSLLPESTRDSALQQDSKHSHPALAFAQPITKPRKPTKTMIGTNTSTDSDNEDLYTLGPSISYNRIIGDKKEKKAKKKNQTTNANPLLKTKPVFKSKAGLSTLLSGLRRCHDGRPPLEGFILADELDSFSTMSLEDEKYAPPKVPPDWFPMKLRQGPKTSEPSDTKPEAERTMTQEHTPQQPRTKNLDESTLPSRSVFDFLTPAARERLVAATGRSDLPQAGSKAPIATVCLLDPATAQAALNHTKTSTFRPYPDVAKQARYESFLKHSSTNNPSLSTSTQSAHRDELDEFARAATVFRPSTASSFLSSRFTSATNKPQPASSAASGTTPATEELLTRPTMKAVDPAEEAARMGFFGIATRSVGDWMPTRLVCKRFGVNVPDK